MTDTDVEVFWGVDPLAAEAALERLVSNGPEVIKEVFPLDSAWPNQAWNSGPRAVRLCKRLGPSVAEHLLRLIKTGTWHVKVTASPCFAAFVGNRAVGEAIFKQLQSGDIDAQRLTIEALGYAAYSSGYSIAGMARYGQPDHVDSRIVPLDRYAMGKLAFYSIQALLRIFAHTGESSLLKECQNLVSDFRGVADNDFSWDIDMVMRELKPIAADGLISKWLDGSDDKYRNHALNGLAYLRLRRTIPALMRFIDHEPTSVAAGIALGDTVHPDAARRLATAVSDGVREAGIGWALSKLYAVKIDWPDCSDLVFSIAQGNGEVAVQMRYSLAVRGDRSILPSLERHLDSDDPFIRGASAIALARLLGTEAEPLLRGRENETSSPIESLLVLAALIHLGRHDLVAELDGAAQKNRTFLLLRPIWKREVLAAFVAGEPPGGKRAELWAEIGHEDLARALSDLEALGISVKSASSAASKPVAPAKSTTTVPPTAPTPSVFVSYSRKDIQWLKRFQNALNPLVRKGAIELWDDTRLKPGGKWKDEIDLAMERASVALLLASQNFLNSEFVMEHELKTLLATAQNSGVTIVWVAIDHALYEDTELGDISAANDPKIPLVELKDGDLQREIIRICRIVRDVILKA